MSWIGGIGGKYDEQDRRSHAHLKYRSLVESESSKAGFAIVLHLRAIVRARAQNNPQTPGGYVRVLEVCLSCRRG